MRSMIRLTLMPGLLVTLSLVPADLWADEPRGLDAVWRAPRPESRPPESSISKVGVSSDTTQVACGGAGSISWCGGPTTSGIPEPKTGPDVGWPIPVCPGNGGTQPKSGPTPPSPGPDLGPIPMCPGTGGYNRLTYGISPNQMMVGGNRVGGMTVGGDRVGRRMALLLDPEACSADSVMLGGNIRGGGRKPIMIEGLGIKGD